ncbi:MAG: hypothetical protein M0Z50_15530 [Planctomycetia bacterium]|nr:hypothetical protein [Planctomycetia bacterium]
MTKIEQHNRRSVEMERTDYSRCKQYIDHAMSYEGGLDGDGYGQLTEIESAIGALLVGQMFGYRVLQLVHSPATCKKYTKLLGISSFREVCPPTGVYSNRNYLFRAMAKVTDWWRGRHRLPATDKARRAVIDNG